MTERKSNMDGSGARREGEVVEGGGGGLVLGSQVVREFLFVIFGESAPFFVLESLERFDALPIGSLTLHKRNPIRWKENVRREEGRDEGGGNEGGRRARKRNDGKEES